MNPRIRELMEEAGYAAPEIAGRAHKLAELIVLECAGYVIGAAEVYTQEDQDACVRASKGLKKYFGVEE